MNTLDTLKDLLGVGISKTSGTVTRIGSNVTVATSEGVMIVSTTRTDLSVGDAVIIEGNQITYNLGRGSEIVTYDA